METKDATNKQNQLYGKWPQESRQGAVQTGFRGVFLVNGRIDSARLARQLDHLEKPKK